MSGIGLVLGAGGLPGEAFHRGVLRALLDQRGISGRDAEVVVGTSAGSLVAASLRLPRSGPVPGRVQSPDVRPSDEEPRVRPLPDFAALAGYARRPWRARPARLTAALLPPGRQSTAMLQEPLRRRFGETWPERHTWIVAASRRDGRRVVFGRDRFDSDLATAVAASCAIPGYFQPVTIGGESFVDGAVHSPTNADLLAGQGLDLVIVSAPMGVRPRLARPVIELPLRLAWHAQLAAEALAVRRSGTQVLVVEPAGSMLRLFGTNPVDARRIDEIEDRAYDLTVHLLHRRSTPVASYAD